MAGEKTLGLVEGPNDKGCQFIESRHVAPGWGCCRCNVYNGEQRSVCKNCGHVRCDTANDKG